MSNFARIEIERDVADVAARRAAEEGMSITAYISLLLRRSYERVPGEESVLAYDHLDGSEMPSDRCVEPPKSLHACTSTSYRFTKRRIAHAELAHQKSVTRHIRNA